MNPLIHNFTQNLKPCTGCGKSEIDYFVEQQAKGESVKYTLQIEAEGEDLISASTSDRSQWKVISGVPQRPAQQPNQGIVTGSQFQRTTTQSTPAPNG